MNPLSTTTEIHDIAANISTVWPERIWALVGILAFVLLLLILFFLYRLWRRRQLLNKKLPPYEASLKALDALEKSLESFDVKYFKLTTLLKIYLNDELKISWLEKTTQEINLEFHVFQQWIAEPSQRDALLELINRSEVIKFAKSEVDAKQFLLDQHLVKKIIQECHQKKSKL